MHFDLKMKRVSRSLGLCLPTWQDTSYHSGSDTAFGIFVRVTLRIDLALVYCSMHGALDMAFLREVLGRRDLAGDDDELHLIEQSSNKSEIYGTSSAHGLYNMRCTHE